MVLQIYKPNTMTSLNQEGGRQKKKNEEDDDMWLFS